MRKEVRGFFRKAAAGVLTAAMCVTSLSTGGIGTALAAPETPAPADREDKSIVYFVDCGDYTVDTVSEGDQLGTHNSVTDQAYGPDAQTGYKWGVVDSEEELEDKKGEGLTNPGAPDNGGVYTANTWAQEGLPVGQELDKMVTNRYSKNFPEKGYDERYVDYAFELEKGKYEITVGCANPWNVSKFQVVKASMETAAQEVALSEEGFAVPSTGAEVSGVVDVTSDTDKVTVDVRGSGGETLCVNVSYIMIQSIKEEETEDEAKVRKDKMSLTLPEEVSEDIKLPSSGENGSKIEWSSSNTDVISNDGKVTRPAAGKEDVSVKLTATITSGDAKDTKEFEVKVLAEPAPVEKAPADREDKDVIYFVDCGDYTVDTVSAGDQLGTHNSVTEQVYGPDAKTGYKWGIVDTKEELPGNPQNGTLPKNGGVYTANTWANEQVDGTNAAKDVTNRYTKNFWEKGIEERFLDYAFEIENGTYDVTVCCVDPWSCSQSPNVYLNYGKDTQATLKEGMEASSKKPATATYEVKDGELTVNFRATGDNNKAINVAYILIRNHREMSEEEKKAEEERRLKSDYASLILNETEICGDIELVKEGANGSTIEWSSSNGAVISTDGKVTRPKTGEDDVFVTLTAKVTYGDSSMEKKFVLKVLAESAATDLQEFTLADVTMEDEYYTNATQKDVDFLNTFDPDRLLYNFRLTAGYTADEIKSGMFDFNNDGDFATKPYNGWENSLISGHTLGHYLAAVAQAVADGYGDEVGGDKRTLKDRLEYLIDSLKDCQDKMGTGYIFGANMENPSKPELQFDILEGKATGGTWVPWYTMHKIVNGLVSTYEYTGNETALEVAENLAEWIYERTSKWDASTNQRVLWTEYGGMNDCLYELYKCARDNGYANLDHIEQAAHKFDEDSLFEAVLSGKENVLNGRHANCTIPKFVGALNRYRALKGEKDVDKYLQYAEAFWTLVVNHHSYITGGNSECEFFGMDDVLDLERSHCNNETCNTHNMLKMTRELYRITGDKKYADYYETNFTNAIMASINEETGMTTYFQPMATGYFKVYGNADLEKNWFWCCTGTGLENFTKLGDAIYFHTADQLVVNQFISSTVTWKDKKVQVKQETDIPVSDTTKFTVSLLDGATSVPMELLLRVPDWAMGDVTVTVNGTAAQATVSGGYVSIKRDWSSNDVVEMKIPLGIKSYTLPDNAGTVYGFKYGPLVLAAELGADDKMTTYQIGVQCDVCQYKIINGEERKISSGYGGTSNQGTFTSETLSVPSDISVDEFIENIEDYLVRDGDTLNFTLNGTDWSGSTPLKFSPYYRIHDQRYGVYWLFSGNDPEQVQERILSSKESGRETNVTLSGVGIGYGSQTEGNKDTYPCMEEAGNGSVGDMGALTRYAKAGGSFSYLFKVDKTKKNYITCQYSPEDNGKTMVIKVGDTVIATDKLDNGGSEIYFKKYEIPDSVVAAAEKYSLKDDTTGTVEERDVIRISFSGAEGEDSPKLHKNAYTSTNYDNNAGIASIKSDIGTVEKVDDSNYKLVVPLGTAQVQVTTELADKYGLLYVEGALVDDTKAKKISLSGGEETVVNLQVYAEDHETKADYKLSIVKKAEASVPAAEKVEVSPAAKTMTVGETLQLKATVSPAGASQSVTYKSGNEAVASVDASGKVTAKKAGTAEIVVASAENANVKATCKITVKEKAASVAVTSIKLSKKSKSMSVGEKFTLKATVSPANASNKAVEFKSSNVKAVSVGKTNGVVTAKKKGTATITATSKANAKVKATCKITVKKPSLKVSGPAKVKKGKSITLKATLKNLKGTVKWSVDKKKIATVKGKGKKATLKGKKAGTVKVTVKVGSVKVTKKVKVSK